MSLAVPCHPFGWSPESAIAQAQNAVGRLALPTGEDGPLEDVVVMLEGGRQGKFLEQRLPDAGSASMGSMWVLVDAQRY